jgi:hypothetical protein
VGTIEMYDPTDEPRPYRFKASAGGPGYYRPASLISMWSSAPFLHNNAVGVFTGDPSVAGRMRAFDDAIEKLLWPGRRQGKGSIWTTTRESFIRIPGPLVPDALKPLSRSGVLEIGPIPTGTPINLLANVDPSLDSLLKLIPAVNAASAAVVAKDVASGKPAGTRSAGGIPPSLVRVLMSASKCPDLVEDRGHEFGASLSDSDKRALIEFLKTL